MYNTLWCDVLKYPVLQDEGDIITVFWCNCVKKLCICVKEGGKFNHQKAQKNFPSSKWESTSRPSNGEQGRNLNTSDRLTMHTWCESIWCRKNSTSRHNVMYSTEIMQILTLCVQIPLSLRHHLKVIVSLASIGQPKMWMSSSMISLQPYICIMHVVISHNTIINNNNLLICYSVF